MPSKPTNSISVILREVKNPWRAPLPLSRGPAGAGPSNKAGKHRQPGSIHVIRPEVTASRLAGTVGLVLPKYRWLVAGMLAVVLLAGGCLGGQRGVPASEGLANFARVSETLWRGAQPDEHGLETLKKLGATTIINLRMADDVVPGEEAAARRLGLGYVNVPLPGWSAPDAVAVARVLLASSPPPVFLHCEHGADRTGTIIACYRIRHDGWTTERALAEARVYGLSGWQFGMKRFVRSFPATRSEGR